MFRIPPLLYRLKQTLSRMGPKTVAIVGAGPGGLVAAKKLLESKFDVTLFEKSDRIGGIWSVTKENQTGIIPIDMPTNLSQFAVTFSDLSWSRLDIPGGPATMHPKAWEVNKYLEEYTMRYVPAECIRFGVEVKHIDQDSDGRWKISYTKTGSDQQQASFDYCVLASGFYSKALPIQCNLEGFDEDGSSSRLVHSSLYRSLQDIVPDRNAPGQKLLVIGGANSGGEAAAALAFDISNAIHAPGGKNNNYEIIHIVPKPIYGLPLFVPSFHTPGTFVPLDVRFYDLNNRPDQPLRLKFGRHTDDSKRMLHGLIQGMLGTDLFENGMQKPLAEHEGELQVPKAAIQDNWASYVRSGAIKVSVGRVTSLQSHGHGQPISATIQTTEGATTTLDDVAGAIYATGYTPQTALSIVSPNILKTLAYDPAYPRLPLLLPEDSLASNPSVPNLGFVGLYEGPYWGVMEMQARQLAHRWTNTETSSVGNNPGVLGEHGQARLNCMEDIRSALKDAPHLVPQYIFSDYTAIMEEASRDLNLKRNDASWASTQGPITPARYLDPLSNKTEAELTTSFLHSIIQASETKSRFVPRCVFRSLQGRWTIYRTLKSERPEYPTGVFEGEAWFHPRAVTPTGRQTTTENQGDSNFDKEYLYTETGTLNTDTGLSISAYKSYAWRLREARTIAAGERERSENLSVWFLKPEDNRSVDYLYHDLVFDAETGLRLLSDGDTDSTRTKKFEWTAKGDHLCEKDMYRTEYRFVFDGVAIERFEVVHQVKGPNKDYVSTTRYRR